MSLSQGFMPADAECTATQFSEAIHALFGDGILEYGAQFSMTIGGFTARLNSGYALSNGRFAWVDDEEPLLIPVSMPSQNKDRTDALVCRVDYAERKASLEMKMDVDEESVRSDPSLVRGGGEYNCIL